MINCPCHPERSEGSHHDTPNRCFVPQHDKQNNRNMKKYSYILLFSLATLLLASCAKSSDPIIDDLDDGMIEISYSQNKFDVSVWNGTRSAETRATQEGTISENAIDDIYILMFKTDGTDPIKYYSGTSASGAEGVWNKTDNVKLKVTQAEAGTRDVYVIANVGGLNNDLDGITNKAGLDALLNSNDTPWSASLGTPADVKILMSGSVSSHNFQTNRKLETVALIRALAKVELNITLREEHQSTFTLKDADNNDVPQYYFNFVDFDKNTYVLENTTKSVDKKESSDWIEWGSTGFVSTYEVDEDTDKVTSLTLVTYINETTNAGSLIDIKLPYNDGGLLPPPEFGFETYTLPLPAKIERNNWYVYDVEI